MIKMVIWIKNKHNNNQQNDNNDKNNNNDTNDNSHNSSYHDKDNGTVSNNGSDSDIAIVMTGIIPNDDKHKNANFHFMVIAITRTMTT